MGFERFTPLHLLTTADSRKAAAQQAELLSDVVAVQQTAQRETRLAAKLAAESIAKPAVRRQGPQPYSRNV